MEKNQAVVSIAKELITNLKRLGQVQYRIEGQKYRWRDITPEKREGGGCFKKVNPFRLERPCEEFRPAVVADVWK